jgi:mannose-6-phosphate isomerase
MEPLVFEPYLRPQIWGGRRLGERLGKSLPDGGDYGESWEISGHAHHVSRVAEGPLRGALLTDLWAQHAREWLGEAARLEPEFPLLIKFLDCHQRLSVQVHPDDATARRLLGDARGKTEAWIVLDADPTGRIYAGLKPWVDRSVLEQHLDAGAVEQCLHVLAPRPGDCFFLPAGVVHAVGGGVLIAEVQQSSDATFRLFDWNRVGADGKPRELHRRESLESIDWSAGPVEPVAAAPLPADGEDVARERLASCAYFQIERYRLGKSVVGPYRDRMSIWMVLAGEAELHQPATGYGRACRAGATILLPACGASVEWTRRGDRPVTLLATALPATALPQPSR